MRIYVRRAIKGDDDMPKEKKNNGKNHTTSNPTPAAANPSSPRAMSWEEMVAETNKRCAAMAGDVKDIKTVMTDQGNRLKSVEEKTDTLAKEVDDLKKRVKVAEESAKTGGKKRSVTGFRYYPGGDLSKPLSDPIEDYWEACQLGGGFRIVKVKCRRNGDKLEVIPSSELNDYS